MLNSTAEFAVNSMVYCKFSKFYNRCRIFSKFYNHYRISSKFYNHYRISSKFYNQNCPFAIKIYQLFMGKKTYDIISYIENNINTDIKIGTLTCRPAIWYETSNYDRKKYQIFLSVLRNYQYFQISSHIPTKNILSPEKLRRKKSCLFQSYRRKIWKALRS